MAKLKEKYELMVIFNTKLGEDGIKELVEKYKGTIERHATLDSVDEWGKRKLAYEIEDETEGFYVLYNFESTPDFPVEIERRLNINENVLRSLVTVAAAAK
jgi:small subunit ribosomal protein S6